MFGNIASYIYTLHLRTQIGWMTETAAQNSYRQKPNIESVICAAPRTHHIRQTMSLFLSHFRNGAAAERYRTIACVSTMCLARCDSRASSIWWWCKDLSSVGARCVIVTDGDAYELFADIWLYGTAGELDCANFAQNARIRLYGDNFKKIRTLIYIWC